MKTCPTCQKTYPDDFSLCPRDGAPLAAQATETEAQLAAGLSRRFRLVRRLGKGGMGTVFLAEQIGVGNRPVALKVLNRKLLDDPDFLMRFQNEAGSTGRIHHPNVVTIYESAQADDGTPYIAMEFLEGESLREVIKQRGALPLPEVAEILQQAARGLNAAHKLGIIHRDLKPDNLFLTRGDEGELVLKVVDFGIAKLRESATHTLAGTVLGTPAYMSFEQASGMKSDELDARSDIYSLGVVVYEMLTGRLPFHSDTPLGYLRKHLQDAPPPFRAVKPDLPSLPHVEAVVMKALTKDRDQRYSSVLEFAQEFAKAAEAGPDLPAQPEPQGETAKPQPQTTVPPAPKTSVPVAVLDTVAAKAVIETAHPARRKGRVRWKRVGIIASVAWILSWAIFYLTSGCDRSAWLLVVFLALVPVPLGWGFIYLVLFLVRWVKPPLATSTPRKPNRAKYVVLGMAGLAIITPAIWHFLPSGTKQEAQKTQGPTSTKAFEKTPEPAFQKPGATAGEVKENSKDGLKYVWIPPGIFMMGCSPGDNKCQPDEKPSHQVTITRGFWMGQTDVTVGAYKRFAAATGRQMADPPNFNTAWANENMPIVNVSWDDAQAYCGWIGGRLPTEAEWEYAARGGNTKARYGPIDEIGWHGDNMGNQAHTVAQKHPNGFGLYDTLGNVNQWVSDWYNENYYQISPSQDPQGPASGKKRALRGGSIDGSPAFLRVSGRDWGGGNEGFRCGGERDRDAAAGLLKPGETMTIMPGPIESGTDVADRRNQVDAAKRQGNKYYENGKYDQAISAYQRGLELDPSNAQILQDLRRAQTAKAAEEKLNQSEFEAPRRVVPASAAGTVRKNPKDGLNYVWIPPGTFMMGCSPGDGQCGYEEKPAHQVTITRGFWIGQTPVTVRAYKRFTGSTGRQMPPTPYFNNSWMNADLAVDNVTWDNAQAYCTWVGGRLPTEGEREYAARGGSTEARYGNLDQIAWPDKTIGSQAPDVGQKRPNGFGLYDMVGNVFEWVNDWYDHYWYRYHNSPSHDPSGPSSGQERVVRGGTWIFDRSTARVSSRQGADPSLPDYMIGFRCGGEVFAP